MELIKIMNEEQVTHALEYRNEAEWAKLKPTKDYPKEVPFIKNNPRVVESAADSSTTDASTGEQ